MNKKLILLLFIISCVFICPVSVSADMGPKPSLTIHCDNMPNTMCYLDLLVENPYSGDVNLNMNNTYNQELIKKLKDYNVDGWRSAMLNGSGAPLFGDIVCNIKDGKCTQNFSYFGTPDKFKIIVVTADNRTVVTKEIKRLAYNSTVHFDFEKAEASEQYQFMSYVLQFLITCPSTLILEGIILLLFRFSLRQNWKPFLLINISTQILLYIVLFYQMTINGGTFTSFLFFMLAEIIIFIAEVILFSELLHQHSKKRRMSFALTANLLSFIAGFIIMLQF